MDDLDTIMSGRESAPAPAPESQPAPQVETPAEPSGQPRDPHGRFASPEAQPPAQPEAPPAQPEPAQPPSGYIPIQALDARLAKQQERYDAQLRQQEAAFNRQMAAFMQPRQPQEQPKPPDFYENPDGAFDHRFQNGIRQAVDPLRGQLMFNAKLVAEGRYGEDTTAEAIQAFDTAAASREIDPSTFQRVMNSPNPFHEAVQWHKERSALSKYGTDPEAYIKAEVERRIAESRAPAAPPLNPQQMPSSFTSAPSAGPRNAPQWNGPRPLSEIMKR